jgi:hypothetical protein
MERGPWKRAWLETTPEEFERMVVAYLQEMGRTMSSFSIEPVPIPPTVGGAVRWWTTLESD